MALLIQRVPNRRDRRVMFNRREQPGWLAIVPRKDRMDMSHVVRGSVRPRLQLLQRLPREGSEAEMLQRARRSLGMLRYRCTTWIEPSAYQMIQVVSPKVPDEELRSALRWSVKDALDFPAEQAMVDVLPIPTDGAPAGRDALALVVAARRQALADRVQ